LTYSVDAYRSAAARVLPRMVFDFVDGGAEREVTLRANVEDFARVGLRPHVLVDVGKVDPATSLLGTRVPLPLAIAPMGLCGIVHPEGERALARAAHAAGIPFTLSTAASHSIETVAQAAPGLLWFQLYVFRDRGLTRSLIQRAREAGYRALAITVDLTRGGRREKDVRNGFTVPPRLTARTAFELLRRPRWMARTLPRARQLTLGNLAGWGGLGTDTVALSTFMNREIDPTATWDYLAWLRSEWDLPLMVKGVLDGADAARAADLGVDAIVVSNHGGRQLDGAPSSIRALPDVVDAVGGRVEVLLDSGVRRGSDIVKALAYGARGVFIGKAALYGLAVGGEAGVARVIELLRQELDTTLALCGRPGVMALDRTVVEAPRSAGERPRVAAFG
jgi:isopentenyl diphosphate isomerase/L-lactate dehydrogenase-like FMN-dependent dehydrogenase